MPERIETTVTIRDADIFYRNFRGKQTDYNALGDKNFCVKLDPAVADAMARDGWNVKMTKPPKNATPDVLAEFEPEPYVQVKIGNPDRGREANVTVITKRGRTRLGYEDLDILDYADIVKVDLLFGPYNWAKAGNTGVTAYLRSFFVTINEDELEEEYNQLPIAGGGAPRTDDDLDA